MYQTRKELESVFGTAAAFYRMETAGKELLCRSLAEIRRKGADAEKADALFVLLNPGQCSPSDTEAAIPLVEGKPVKISLVKAEPDNTLYQLMRLMERMDWNFVRIVNLTDIRTGKFSEYKETQDFMELHGVDRHSLFSKEREFELEQYIDEADKVVAGWGINSAILDSAEYACCRLLEYKEVYGLRHEDFVSFYHPFPWIRSKCIKWLDDMEQHLKQPAQVMHVHLAILE